MYLANFKSILCEFTLSYVINIIYLIARGIDTRWSNFKGIFSFNNIPTKWDLHTSSFFMSHDDYH